MKYVISLVVGIIVGAALFCAGLYYNPFADRASVSPLAVSAGRLIDLNFSDVPAEAILFTNDGESIVKPFPSKTQQLWEPSIKNSWVAVVVLTNARGDPLGIGVKFSNESEATRLLNAQALIDSVWHVYLPGQGTFFVDQTENYWSYLRDIVIPARWNSSNSWRGLWNRNTTAGPGALGTARVVGGSGEFADHVLEAVESISARAYSSQQGPVAMNGNLIVALPGGTDTDR